MRKFFFLMFPIWSMAPPAGAEVQWAKLLSLRTTQEYRQWRHERQAEDIKEMICHHQRELGRAPIACPAAKLNVDCLRFAAHWSLRDIDNVTSQKQITGPCRRHLVQIARRKRYQEEEETPDPGPNFERSSDNEQDRSSSAESL
jgi:hypothetical protein